MHINLFFRLLHHIFTKLNVFKISFYTVCKDYGHGTGHGVGAALNVHEGPFGISSKYGNHEGLKKGMVVSNEPG